MKKLGYASVPVDTPWQFLGKEENETLEKRQDYDIEDLTPVQVAHFALFTPLKGATVSPLFALTAARFQILDNEKPFPNNMGV